MEEPIWEADQWWQVLDRTGAVWCETTSEQGARANMRDGDTLHRLFTKAEHKWVQVQ